MHIYVICISLHTLINPLIMFFLRIICAIRNSIRRFHLTIHRSSILLSTQGGTGLHLDGPISLVYADRLSLGSNVHIGCDSFFNCLGGITIGDNSIISRRVTIYSYDHGFKMPSRLPYGDDVVCKPVRIGRYVWIGMNVTIAPGTDIGDGVVIGMGAVVSGSIPPNAIIVSPKARIIGYRNSEHTHSLAEQDCFYLAA